MIILPITYLGDTRYYSAILTNEDCVIDLGENYVKQTGRNRCDILTANGPASLTVNVVKGGSKTKCPVRDMRIDYSKRWQHQHWLSLMSAYRNSPYFDHFGELFAPFYERRSYFLADYNLGLMEIVMKLLGAQGRMPKLSETYIEAAEGDTDLRSEQLTASAYGNSGTIRYTSRPYYQVFSERYPFVPNLSVIDLLFCEGRGAKDILIGSANRLPDSCL